MTQFFSELFGQDILTLITWIGIGLCLIQSGMFSGLNLGLLGINRLRLEAETDAGNPAAKVVMELRHDFNFLLTTLLWGNVSVNVLLTLLSDSVMSGAVAFLFSTIGITFFGEILPQAYFSRHALRLGAFAAPVVRFYMKVLWVVAKPSAKFLDWWLGPEGIQYIRESSFKHILKKHIHADESDIGKLEGHGALNFLYLDDLKITQEGEVIDPQSIIALPLTIDLPIFPEISKDPSDPFLQKVYASQKKWVILTDLEENPRLVLDASDFLIDFLFQDRDQDLDPYDYCHRPIVITDPQVKLGKAIQQFKIDSEHPEDDVIDDDLILYWGDERRIITGADLLGRLLRGVIAPEKQV
ncbi:MAG: DUF21 domain-containing protein [SAR324 cluster bacterium]|nr:DUF21 domain-containing protein [SAR324 cluster bacterium]